MFRSLMFEADAERFRNAGVRVGSDLRDSERELLEAALAPFPLETRNSALYMSRAYAIMFCFEQSVREMIVTRLSERDADWWVKYVPQKVRSNAESRQRNSEENSWLEGDNKDLMGFVDFNGLADIIVNSWAEFEDLIPAQQWLKQRMNELEHARNFIAHNRSLSHSDFQRIEMYIKDWNKQVGI